MCFDLRTCTCVLHVKTCWSPCFWHSNVRTGSVAVALYTMAMSFCLIVYTAYLMNGGDASQVYLPYFEANLSTSMQSGGGFTIFFMIVFIIFSALLMVGVKQDIRGLMIPWMGAMWVVFFFQVQP